MIVVRVSKVGRKATRFPQLRAYVLRQNGLEGEGGGGVEEGGEGGGVPHVIGVSS